MNMLWNIFKDLTQSKIVMDQKDGNVISAILRQWNKLKLLYTGEEVK